MASKLVFGPYYTSTPGVFTDVDASGMAKSTPLSTGILAILGECSGGGVGASNPACTVQVFKNQDAAARVLRYTGNEDLREYVRAAFEPSKDTVVGGAKEVRIVKVNPSVVASRMLTNGDGNALLLTSKDAGLFCNRISVLKSMSGVAPADTCDLELALDTINESLSAIGSPWFSLRYTAGSFTTMTASVSTDGSGNPDGMYATATRVDAAGEATAVAYGAGEIAVVACNAANNGHTVTIYGVNSDGQPDSDSGLIAAGAWTSSKHWLRVTAATLSADVAVGNLTVSDSAPGATVNLTITFGVGNRSTGRKVLTSCPAAGRTIALVATGGATTDPIVLRGLDTAGAVQSEVIWLAGAIAVYSRQAWTRLDSLEIGGLPAGRGLTLTAQAANVRTTTTSVATTSPGMIATEVAAFVPGSVGRAVSSAAAADNGRVITLYGLDTTNVYQTEVLPPLAGLGVMVGTATWNAILYATVDAYATGSMSITDLVPTTFQTIDVARLTSGLLWPHSAGYHPINVPVAGTTVSLVADGGTTRRAMVVGLSALNVVQRELVTLAGAVAVPTVGTWNRIDGLYLGDVEAARTVNVIWGCPITGGYTKISELADAFNALSGFTATTLDTAPTTDLISEFDIPTVATYGSAQPLNVYGITKTWYAKLTELIRAITARSALVVATRPNGATGLPSDILAKVYLSGGSEGVTTNADWLAALQKIRSDGSVNAILVATTNAAVHAALVSQLRDRATTLKKECSGFSGLAAGSTKAQIKAAIRLLNSCQIQICAQERRGYDSMLVSRRFSPVMQAALAAGMFCGAEVGRALTRRYLNADELYQDSSWDPIDDSTEMIDAGLLFAVEKSGVGYYWQRDVTTHLIDNNNAYVEASCKREVDTFCRNGREWLDAKVGDPNFAGTTTALKTLAFQLLQYAVAQGWIVAWRNLTAVSSGDTSALSVDIAPTQPLNFIPWAIHLYEVTTVA